MVPLAMEFLIELGRQTKKQILERSGYESLPRSETASVFLSFRNGKGATGLLSLS